MTSKYSARGEETMKKGIAMRLEIYVEGEAPPAQDFTQTGRDIILQVLRSGIQQSAGTYAVRLRKIEPLEGGSDDDGDAEDFDPSLDLLGAASSPQPPPQPPTEA